MIEFIKERKIIVIVGIMAIVLMVWNIFNAQNNYEEVEKSDVLVSENETTENKKEDNENMIIVHITGEVKKPGVVKLKEGSRIEDIIEAAGGLTENADITNVNLAFIVEDGTKIRIPSNDEGDTEQDNYISADSGKGVILSDEKEESSSTISIVNINTATQTELEELPGIGPSIAIKIIEHRNQNGKFKSIEDIKNVTGIGENKFEKIKAFIKVK